MLKVSARTRYTRPGRVDTMPARHSCERRAVMNRCNALVALLAVGLSLEGLFAVRKLQADEGMWLLNDPPRALLKKKYDFDLTDTWLEHAQKSSIRFNNGGSG